MYFFGSYMYRYCLDGVLFVYLFSWIRPVSVRLCEFEKQISLYTLCLERFRVKVSGTSYNCCTYLGGGGEMCEWIDESFTFFEQWRSVEGRIQSYSSYPYVLTLETNSNTIHTRKATSDSLWRSSLHATASNMFNVLHFYGSVLGLKTILGVQSRLD